MTDNKQRVEIPREIAADVLFESDRTCCVCRQPRRPITLHHIDGDPSNSIGDNLAVLCLDCHRETQIEGGFDRKLDAFQVRRYKADWIERVEARRSEGGSIRVHKPCTLLNNEPILRYFQLKKKSDEQSYEFEADYVLVGSSDSKGDSETNLRITAFVTQCLQRLRADAIGSIDMKKKLQEKGHAASAHDSLSVAHNVALFTPLVLSLEFQLWSYWAGAAHPSTQTETLNFRLHPSTELKLHNVFKPSSNYLNVLSAFCLNDIYKQKAQRGYGDAGTTEEIRKIEEHVILSATGPEQLNYERFSLRRYGIVIHFDEGQVGTRVEGKYEVFVPAYELKGLVRGEIAALLNWHSA